MEPPEFADEVYRYRERGKEGIKNSSEDFGLTAMVCSLRQGRAGEEQIGDEE